jgi:hypothetical protein
MKKFMFSLVAIIVSTVTFAQNEYKKAPAIGVSFVLNDFKAASDLRTSGLSDLLKAKQWSKTSRMASGLAVNYSQGVNNYVDFAASLTGSFLDYPVPNKVSNGQQNLLLEAVATANVKFVTDKRWFNPFLTVGVGASKYKGYFAALLPVGAGIQFKLLDDVFILVNSQYRIPISENAGYHFYHSFGITQTLNKKK